MNWGTASFVVTECRASDGHLNINAKIPNPTRRLLFLKYRISQFETFKIRRLGCVSPVFSVLLQDHSKELTCFLQDSHMDR